MKTLTNKLSNGNEITYQLIEDGGKLPIAYHAETNIKIVEALEVARENRTRIKIYLGDTRTGRDWGEENDNMGYVGLSKGHEARYPILVKKSTSYGGGSLLDNRIVKIRESKGTRVLYQHPEYKAPVIEIREGSKEDGYTYELWVNGELYSNHKSHESAKRLKTKLS